MNIKSSSNSLPTNLTRENFFCAPFGLFGLWALLLVSGSLQRRRASKCLFCQVPVSDGLVTFERECCDGDGARKESTGTGS